jgi:hypothetical protein
VRKIVGSGLPRSATRIIHWLQTRGYDRNILDIYEEECRKHAEHRASRRPRRAPRTGSMFERAPQDEWRKFALVGRHPSNRQRLRHWLVADINPKISSLPEAVSGFRTSAFDEIKAYIGPLPPFGTHLIRAWSTGCSRHYLHLGGSAAGRNLALRI